MHILVKFSHMEKTCPYYDQWEFSHWQLQNHNFTSYYSVCFCYGNSQNQKM